MASVDADPQLPERYRVIRGIGRGGMGVVVLAEDRELGRTVAVKIARWRDDEERRRQRFLAEARATAQLQHPSIVPVYDVLETRDGRLAFSMRYVEGRSMRDEIAACRAGAPDARGMTELLIDFLKISDAVAYAHSRGVLHRDLKPANVMLGRFGETMLMDWGLVGATGDAPDPVTLSAEPRRTALTAPGTLVGSPGYVAPEQVRGSPASVLSEVWSLGAILYEIVTLERAVPGPVAAAILANTIVQPITPPRDRAPDRAISEALQAIVMRALSPDAAQRFTSVSELRAAVATWIDVTR